MNGNRTSDRYAHENRDGHIHTTSNYPPPCSNLNVLPQHWIIGYDGTNELLCQIARASPWSYTDILLVQFIQLNKVRVLLSIVQDESMNLATDTDINIIVVMLIEHCPGPVYSFKTFRRLRLRWLYSLLEPLLPVIAVATTFLSFCTSFYGDCVPPPPPTVGIGSVDRAFFTTCSPLSVAVGHCGWLCSPFCGFAHSSNGNRPCLRTARRRHSLQLPVLPFLLLPLLGDPRRSFSSADAGAETLVRWCCSCLFPFLFSALSSPGNRRWLREKSRSEGGAGGDTRGYQRNVLNNGGGSGGGGSSSSSEAVWAASGLWLRPLVGELWPWMRFS